MMVLLETEVKILTTVGSLAEMQSIVQAQLDEEQRKVQREILQECERRGADLADELVKHYSKEGDGGAVDLRAEEEAHGGSLGRGGREFQVEAGRGPRGAAARVSEA